MFDKRFILAKRLRTNYERNTNQTPIKLLPTRSFYVISIQKHSKVFIFEEFLSEKNIKKPQAITCGWQLFFM